MVEPESENLHRFIEGNSKTKFSNPFAKFEQVKLINSVFRDIQKKYPSRIFLWDIGKRVQNEEDCTDMINHWTPSINQLLLNDLFEIIATNVKSNVSKINHYDIISNDEENIENKKSILKNYGIFVDNVYTTHNYKSSEFRKIIVDVSNLNNLEKLNLDNVELYSIKLPSEESMVNDPIRYKALADMFSKGESVEKDHNKAIQFYRKAGEIGLVGLVDELLHGNSEEQSEAYNLYVDYCDCESKDINILKLMEYKLGLFYRYLAKDKNINLAIDLFEKSALKYYYQSGIEFAKALIDRNVGNDCKIAMSALENYSNMHIDSSYIPLGTLLCSGKVPKNFKKSKKYLDLAFDLKLKNSEVHLFDLIWSIQTREFDAELPKIMKRIEETHNPLGTYRVGLMFRYGRGVDKNLQEAAKWLINAISLGNKYAAIGLFDVYWEMGEYSTDNQLLKTINPLVEENFPDALLRCAWIYRDGRGVRKNIDTYLSYLKRAADLGNKIAQSEYSKIHCMS